MKLTLIERIIDWNEERHLLNKPFSPENEALNIIEEVIEGFTCADSEKSRNEALRFYNRVLVFNPNHTDESLVDSYADIVVYAIGAIKKLGYNPEQVMEEVLKEIESRTGKWDKDQGKFIKDKNVPTYKAKFIKE